MTLYNEKSSCDDPHFPVKLDGVYIGQPADEALAGFHPLEKEGWDPEYEVFFQELGIRFTLKDGYICGISNGKELCINGKKKAWQGMHVSELLESLGEPFRKWEGDYATGRFDEHDNPIEHPQSPGIIRAVYRIYGHEISFCFFRGPTLLDIGIKHL